MSAVYGIDFNTKYLDFIISPYKKKYLNAGNKINIIIDETNATSFTVLIDLSDGTNDNKALKEWYNENIVTLRTAGITYLIANTPKMIQTYKPIKNKAIEINILPPYLIIYARGVPALYLLKGT